MPIDRRVSESVVRIPFIRCRYCHTLLVVEDCGDPNVFPASCPNCGKRFKLTMTWVRGPRQ